MITLETALGERINCEAVVAGNQYPYLHIHTSELTRVQADTIFDNPAQTETLKVDTGETEKTYTGFTTLFSVQTSPFIPNALLIWLNRTMEEET